MIRLSKLYTHMIYIYLMIEFMNLMALLITIPARNKLGRFAINSVNLDTDMRCPILLIPDRTGRESPSLICLL